MSKDKTLLLFAYCAQCKSTALNIYFHGNKLGAMCSKCKSVVFETDSLEELMKVAMTNQVDKPPTLKNVVRKRPKKNN